MMTFLAIIGLIAIIVFIINNIQVTNSDKSQLLITKALTAYKRGDYYESVRILTVAISQYPTEYQIWNNRGNSKYQLGLYEEALEDFNKSIEINPDSDKNMVAYLNQKKSLLALGSDNRQKSSTLKSVIRTNDENTWRDFKMTTTTSQKDAVLFFFIFISRADPTIDPKEDRYMAKFISYFYDDSDPLPDILQKEIDMYTQINHLTNFQKRIFVQLIYGLILANEPVKRNKAERFGYIVEKIGITENELESILLEKISKNAIIGL